MALPKEPRQKMINLMYLVLTAMLALNVSVEILNAFKTVDSSLQTTNGIIEDKNTQLMNSLAELAKDEKTRSKAAIWQPLAEQARQSSDSVYNYIENLKMELKIEAGYNPPKDTTFKEDNLEASTRLFVESPPVGKEKGQELKAKLEGLKAKLLGLHPDIAKDFANSLPIDLRIPKSNNSTSKKDWSSAYFHMTPTVAALTILSKFQNDIRNSEAQIIEYCHKEVGEVKVVFDTYVPLVGTSSQYLMPGQELVINAGIGAYSKAANPHITIDGAAATMLSDGTTQYKTTVGGPGSYIKKVHIDYFNQATGKMASLDVPVQYTVGSPTGLSVSADAVKVLYVGLDNPVTISGGAKGAEAVTARIDNGSIKNNGGGKYTVNVESAGNATINVTMDGKTTPFNFRVKNVPLPTPMIGNSGGGSVSVNAFKANQGLRAELKDFVFEGVKYSVTSYVIICTGKGFESTGYKYATVNSAYFNAEAKQYIEMCRPGSSVIFQNIVVNGPGGSRRIDGTLAFNLTQ
jgi:gliding motility-associated protein GldM